METALNDALETTNNELLNQVIGATVLSLNSADCSSLQGSECTDLGRAPCTTTQQTCGECLNTYVGDPGHSNYPCYPIEVMKTDSISRRRRLNIGDRYIFTGHHQDYYRDYALTTRRALDNTWD